MRGAKEAIGVSLKKCFKHEKRRKQVQRNAKKIEEKLRTKSWIRNADGRTDGRTYRRAHKRTENQIDVRTDIKAQMHTGRHTDKRTDLEEVCRLTRSRRQEIGGMKGWVEKVLWKIGGT